jgi:DNA gyrase subunit A
MSKKISSKKQDSLPLGEKLGGVVMDRPISQEVQESFLDYAMSVIIDRALPDIRDGFKPVHRRILYAMWQMGLKSGAKFRKSATVVGEVLGKFHPHGDSAVYDTLVRMAQDFSMRHTLVHGQGNFGSLDGDSAAAYRYTECKLRRITEEILSDIDKDTVDFRPNFDGSQKEPTVLPAKLPTLLLNGTVGIAVGMATSIPPHNLVELCSAISYVIDHPDCTVEDLVEIVKGPDFPTGGIIYDKKAILQAYSTGRGGIVTRAKTEIIEEKSGQFQIIVSEIPYMVNKATLIESIANLVQEKKIDGIKGLRDESDENVRIVIELKKDSYPKKVLNRLFHLTQLQTTFHLNMLALVDGVQPQVLNLKSVLEHYLVHRQVVIRRRTEFDLAKAKERAHILEGLKRALDRLDEVIATIRKSADREAAKINLIGKFDFTEMQAGAILDMRLSQLANLERQKVEDELREKLKLIKELEAILATPKMILDIIKADLEGLVVQFGEERRTELVATGVKEFAAEDLIPNEAALIMITRDGYIKRLPPDTFKTQARGGKGIIGLLTKEEDSVESLFSTNSHANLLFFTTRGRVFQLKAYEIPQTTRTSKGQAMVNFLQLAPGEKVSAVLYADKAPDRQFLFMATRQGTVKKTPLTDFANVRRNGLIAMGLKQDDVLEWVKPTSGKNDVVMVTSGGMSIRFNEGGVRAMGRVAGGVRGIKLRGGDHVVCMDVIEPDTGETTSGYELMSVMGRGYGKRTNLGEYRVQGRGGSGVKAAKVTEKTGKVHDAFVISSGEERDVMVISSNGQVIRLPAKSVPVLGRDTQGVRVMRFKAEGDSVASVTLV